MVRKIYVDLDVLIDTVALHEAELAVAKAHDISKNEYELALGELCRRYGPDGFSFPNLYTVLLERFPRLPEEIVNALRAVPDCGKFLVGDAIAFLTRFDYQELVVVTDGNEEVEENKIRSQSLARYIGEYIIAKAGRKAEVISDDAEKTFFVSKDMDAIRAVSTTLASVTCLHISTSNGLTKAASFITNYI